MAISEVLADKTSGQIDEDLALADLPEFILLTADQFIDQLPPQLAVVATSLCQEASHFVPADEISEQEIVERLINNSENSDENRGTKKHGIALATSTSHRLTTEYPLANLAAPFTKSDTSPSQSLLQPISSTAISATVPTNAIENSELFTVSTTTNNSPLSLTSFAPNPTSSTHSIAPTINSIALTTSIN